MNTIVSYLRKHAESTPNQLAFTYIEDNGDKTEITFSELYRDARELAYELVELFGCREGDVVVLLYPQGMQYVKAFLGCLYAGLVAVPLYPPTQQQHTLRALNVASDCGARLALTSPEQVQSLKDLMSPMKVESLINRRFDDPIFKASEGNEDQLAFLQYTSGSTGAPKGVMVSHGNIIANLQSLTEATNCTNEEIFCNWLPLFHDLGLVNTILLPIYLGCHSILMSPARFMRRPQVWLNAITDFRATVCGAPNFAYRHCLDRIGKNHLDQFNLSSWRVAFNAAEPIDAATLKQFSDYFSSQGFSPAAWYPAYGMAEATVFVSGSCAVAGPMTRSFNAEELKLGRAIVDSTSEKTLELVGCGAATSNHTIKIVNTRLMCEENEGVIGEIWFSGPSVTQGYWKDDNKTRENYNGQLVGDSNSYLKTGDVGFILDGQLFVTGREKEIIIINGRNYLPHDIEKLTFDACAGLRDRGIIAVERQGSVTLIIEVATKYQKVFDFDEACHKIRSTIFQAADLLIGNLVFIRSGGLTKTSSGKVQRRLALSRYENKDLEILFDSEEQQSLVEFVAPSTDIEAYLTELWSDLLSCNIGVYDNYFERGGCSITASQTILNINQYFNISITIAALFQYPTIRALARYIEQRKSGAQSAIQVQNSKVTRGQESLWLIDKLGGGSPQYNLGSLFTIKGDIDVEALRSALNEIIARHSILRTNYIECENGVATHTKDTWVFNLNISELVQSELVDSLVDQMYLPFDLTEDLMMRATLFPLGENQYVLCLLYHHIAVDGTSLSIIISELNQLYRYAIMNSAETIDRCRPEFSDYVNHSNNRFLDKDTALEYWRNALKDVAPENSLPLDYPRKKQQSFSGASILKIIPEALTGSLRTLAKRHKVTLFTLLQTAFSYILHRYSGQNIIVIGTPYVHRDKAEYLPMVGNFVEPLILINRFEGSRSFDEQLAMSHQAFLEALVHDGAGFADIVNSLQLPRSLSHNPIFQIMFTFNGQSQEELKIFGAITDTLEFTRQFSRFDLTLEITDEKQQLATLWEYCSDLFTPGTIEQLSDNYLQLLSSIVCDPTAEIRNLDYITSEHRKLVLSAGTSLISDQNSSASIITSFNNQVAKNPNKIAARFGNEAISYANLKNESDKLAYRLIGRGVKPGAIVAICMERSIDLLSTLWGVLKSGAAYLPLDPGYPLERIDYMLNDAGVATLMTTSEIAAFLDVPDGCEVICIDRVEDVGISSHDSALPVVQLELLAYIIYTSGSTGRPKAVKITHANVVSFFTGLDKIFVDQISVDARWLAVTSICFDISVLELFWTLCRGNTISIQPDRPVLDSAVRTQQLDFGLFYFASDCRDKTDKFNLMLQGAEFADKNALSAVWLPERHFHSFGGQFANPAIAAAAVAATTKHISIRSGSVVLPLHDPIRVAEEWSMVDNLSGGRVALSIAPGWQPNDFVLNADAFKNRHDVMRKNLDTVKRLWRGEAISRRNGLQEDVNVAISPRPIQSEIEVWITCGGNVETFRYAGEIGANVLTHLLGQSNSELAEKISVYRQALVDNGFSIEQGRVSLMLHTFIHPDENYVNDVVSEPFRCYLRDSISLIAPFAEQFNLDLTDNIDEIVELAYKRYYESSGLFGSPEKCQKLIDQLSTIGVNEIACLIDFGIDDNVIIEAFGNIKKLMTLSKRTVSRNLFLKKRADTLWNPESIIARDHIDTLQCTPTFARELDLDRLKAITNLLVGGEQLPKELAQRLCGSNNTNVFNMYGPTEATVWVSANLVKCADEIYIAGPMLNNQFLVLDQYQKLVPMGVSGELYISGGNLSDGYLNMDALTDERFIDNPFAKNGQLKFKKMYRTGDCCRWIQNSAGVVELEYLGRLDNQIKINGYRIELGEVETILEQFTSVEQAVVTNRDGMLCAYICGDQVDHDKLRGYVSAHLPDYMCPVFYFDIDVFPVTPNGKIDRNSLPNFESMTNVICLPESDIELLIYNVWSVLLDVKEFDVGDNFFHLGGNSLKAVKVVSEVNIELNKLGMSSGKIKTIDLFSANNVRDLAALVEERVSIVNNMAEFQLLELDEVEW